MGKHQPLEGYEAFLDKFMAAVNTRDIEQILPMFHEEGIWERAVGPEPYGARFAGKDAIREGARDFNTERFPAAHYSDATVYIDRDADVATVEFDFSYDQGSGARISSRGVDVLTFRDGLIAIKHTYYKQLAH